MVTGLLRGSDPLNPEVFLRVIHPFVRAMSFSDEVWSAYAAPPLPRGHRHLCRYRNNRLAELCAMRSMDHLIFMGGCLQGAFINGEFLIHVKNKEQSLAIIFLL